MRALHATAAAEGDFALLRLLEAVVLRGVWLTLGSQVSLWMFLRRETSSTHLTLSPQACHSTDSPVYHPAFHFPFIYFFCLFVFWLLEISHTFWMDYIYILINIFLNHFKWMHNYCMDVWQFIHLPMELFDFSQLEITFG